MNRKVIYARLHTEAYIPGAGSLGTVFPPQSKTLNELNMEAKTEGLTINFSYRGLKKQVFVPWGNVVLTELAPEDK